MSHQSTHTWPVSAPGLSRAFITWAGVGRRCPLPRWQPLGLLWSKPTGASRLEPVSQLRFARRVAQGYHRLTANKTGILLALTPLLVSGIFRSPAPSSYPEQCSCLPSLPSPPYAHTKLLHRFCSLSRASIRLLVAFPAALRCAGRLTALCNSRTA